MFFGYTLQCRPQEPLRFDRYVIVNESDLAEAAAKLDRCIVAVTGIHSDSEVYRKSKSKVRHFN